MLKTLFLIRCISFAAIASPTGIPVQPTERANFSTKVETAEGSDIPGKKQTLYIGHYGESFTYLDDWSLHRPFVNGNIEVIRFHRNPFGKDIVNYIINDVTFSHLENYTRLNLVQLLVIPSNLSGDMTFAELQAAKAKDLKARGVVFEFADAPMPYIFWPKTTFSVYIKKPYPLYQLYVESDGKRYILTCGLELDSTQPRFLGDAMAEDIISSLGRYFLSKSELDSQMRTPTPTPESFDFYFRATRWLTIPLFLAGILLLNIPFYTTILRPLGKAMIAAALLATFMQVVGFHLVLLLPESKRTSTLAATFFSALLAIVPIVACFIRTRLFRTSRQILFRSIVMIFGLALFFIMKDFMSLDAGDLNPAGHFSSALFVIGLCYGAIVGFLNKKTPPTKINRIVLALLCFNAICLPSASAQASHGGGVTLDEDLILATERVDARSHGGNYYRGKAEAQLSKNHSYFRYQRVEITGVMSKDNSNDFAWGMFDLQLKPSHRNDVVEVAGENAALGRGVWEWLKYKRNQKFNPETTPISADIHDLLIDKTGRLTPHAKSALGPLLDRTVFVNEIVAHSWGAVILNNAIREGVINPPKRIIVVGVPDTELLKWQQLSLYTGTQVDVFYNVSDKALAVASLHDSMTNTDLAGRNTDYNNGLINAEWDRWAKKNKAVSENRGLFLVDRNPLSFSVGDIFGLKHERADYYSELAKKGILRNTAIELEAEQHGVMIALASELREADIQREIEKIQRTKPHPQYLLAEYYVNIDGLVYDSRNNVEISDVLEAIKRSRRAEKSSAYYADIFSAFSHLAVSACNDAGNLPREGLMAVRVMHAMYRHQGILPLSAIPRNLSRCADSVFDKLFRLIEDQRYLSGEGIRSSIQTFVDDAPQDMPPKDAPHSQGYSHGEPPEQSDAREPSERACHQVTVSLDGRQECW